MTRFRRSHFSSSRACTLLALLFATTALVAAPSAQADDPSIPDLIYKIATGEVILDPTDGGSIIGYELNSAGEFFPGNFTPALAGVATATTSEFAEADLVAITIPASIGEVFPTWLDAAGLDSLLTTRTVVTTLGGTLLNFDLIVQLPGIASNASFSMGSDVNVLNLDFGTVNIGADVIPLDFSITNFAPVGDTARLNLIFTPGNGDTGNLTTDVAPFTNLLAGDSLNFNASIDTSNFGSFSSSYDLNFTDILGTNQTLTLNLTGEVDLFDDPANPDLIYFSSTGELFIDPTDSGGIIGYTLKSDNAFNDANFTPFMGGVVTSLPGELAEATLTTLTTIESLGVVLPTGLTASELIALFNVRDVSTALGAPIVQFDVLFGGCIIGDADCDGYIDIAGDILPGFSNFTGPGSFGKIRAQGDVHGPTAATSDPSGHDGDVDVQDLLVMFGAFTGPAPDGSGGGLVAADAGDANIPDLIYNPLTGEVTLDVDGSGIIGYVLKNGSNSFAFGSHLQILAGVKTSVAGELSEAAFATSVGANSIGNVFPLGMDLAALTAYLTVNDVSRSLGAPVVPFDLVVLSTGPAVPEPATVLLSVFGLVGLGLLAYRRRRVA